MGQSWTSSWEGFVSSSHPWTFLHLYNFCWKTLAILLSHQISSLFVYQTQGLPKALPPVVGKTRTQLISNTMRAKPKSYTLRFFSLLLAIWISHVLKSNFPINLYTFSLKMYTAWSYKVSVEWIVFLSQKEVISSYALYVKNLKNSDEVNILNPNTVSMYLSNDDCIMV